MAATSHLFWLIQLVNFAATLPASRYTESLRDVGLYNQGFLEGDIIVRQGKSAFFRNPEPIVPWPNGVVIYKLDERIGCPESVLCHSLMKAFDHYHEHTCIRFQEWTGEREYVFVIYNTEHDQCYSFLGRADNGQYLSLGPSCWIHGLIVHEFGHTIGLRHEMNRADRDNYIKINLENVNAAMRFNFDKLPIELAPDDPFDLRSIMMYDEFAFAMNFSTPTIEVLDNKTIIGPVWKKAGLSDVDKKRIEKLYKCDRNEGLRELPYDVNCSFINHTCGFQSNGENPWKLTSFGDSPGFVYLSSLGEPNQTSFFVSVSFHGKNSLQDDIKEKGCVSFQYMVSGGGDGYLKLRQVYLTSTTQQAIVPADMYDLWESEENTADWVNQQVDLYVTKPFKLVFEGSPGAGSTGYIAIADFKLSFSPCP